MDEFEQAIAIASRFLDDGDAFGKRDPDGDECVLARQFNRLRERLDGRLSLTENNGWYHVWYETPVTFAKPDWPTPEHCQAEIDRVLHAFADGRAAFIRRKPEVVSHKDFDTKITRHRGTVRFSFKTEPGEWSYPDPAYEQMSVGFGLAALKEEAPADG